MPNLKLGELKPWLELHCRADVPTLVLGGPGSSKTQQHEQLARKLDRPLLKVHLSRHSPTDIAGFQIPDFATRTTVPTKPHIVEACHLLAQETGKAPILFLDELLNITPATLISVRQLILEGRVDSFELPPGTWRCAAANTSKDRAHTLILDPPTANRMAHATVQVNIDDWVRNFAIPTGIDFRIIGLLRYRTALLDTFNPEVHSEGNYAFATLRSWELADRLLKAAGDNPDYNILSGVVGPGPATEMIAFSDNFGELPDMQDIFNSPTKARIPSQAGGLYAVCAAIASHCTIRHFPAAMTYLQRIKRPEFTAFAILDIAHKDISIMSTKEYGDWIREHGNLMLNDPTAS